jgi:hypothetical protein
MIHPQEKAEQKRRFVSGLGRWLRTIVRRAQRADPQWDEEVKRERRGQMGENIQGQEQKVRKI